MIFIRIISGNFRGLKLNTLEGVNTRPTLDRVRETIFNVIAFDLEGAKTLDLFAGSGAFGLECISRNAKESYFVDNNKDAIGVINTNIKKAKAEDKCFVFKSEYDTFIKQCDEVFDIIFIDPPYNQNLHNEALVCIRDNNLISDDGIIIVEVDKKDTIDEENLTHFEIYKEKRFKNTCCIYFLRKSVS